MVACAKGSCSVLIEKKRMFAHVADRQLLAWLVLQ